MKNDGGPAFPVECTWTDEGIMGKQTGPSSGMYTGLTLRDYFAAAALQGLIAYPDDMTGIANDEDWMPTLSTRAYKYADAMLEAREKE